MSENGANIQEVKANISLVGQKTDENGAKIEQVQTDVGANGAKIKQVETQVDQIINIIHYININDTMIIIKGV